MGSPVNFVDVIIVVFALALAAIGYERGLIASGFRWRVSWLARLSVADSAPLCFPTAASRPMRR